MNNPSRRALAALFAVSTTAMADTVTITYDNSIFAHGSANGLSLNITSPSRSLSGVEAGEFQATVNSHTGAVTDANFVDSTSDFFLYCYDLFQYISPGGTYTYTINYAGALPSTLAFLGAVNDVLTGGADNDPYAWLHPTSTTESAAIQLGIWESLYDAGGTWSLSSGNFTASGYSSSVGTEYASFITALNGGGTTPVPLSQTMVLTSPDVQDQITGNRPPQRDLPEPGSLALIAAGLLAAGAARRARKG